MTERKRYRMSEVQRICSQCGQTGSLDARFCPHCGHDAEEQTLPVQQLDLPVLVGKAAVPVLLGAASLALRMGWRLLHSRWAQETVRSAAQTVVDRMSPRSEHTEQPPAQRPASRPVTPTSRSIESIERTPRAKRTIRITSTWTVGDANGTWRRGASQHTIEIDD